MSRRRIVLELTRAEAEALWTSADTLLCADDAAASTFPNPSERSAAYRARAKLAAAIPGRPTRTEEP